MKNTTVFDAMSMVRDNLITESLSLLETPAAAARPKSPHAFSRFINSGWGVAVICAVVSLSVLAGIIWAGQNPRIPPAPHVTEEPTSESDGEPDSSTESSFETETSQEPASETESSAESVPDPAPAADVWNGRVDTAFASGNGTASNPYVIQTGTQLAYLAQKVNGGTTYAGKYFRLAGDLNLNGRSWTPIGTYDKPFSGIFDGGGHTVSGLLVDKTAYSGDYACAGLFGHVRDGRLTGLYLDAPTVTVSQTTYAYVGALCGYYSAVKEEYTDGVLENCRVLNGQITLQKGSEAHVGGLVGYLLAPDGVDVRLNGLESRVTLKVSGYGKAHVGSIAGYLRAKGSGRIEMAEFCGYTTASAQRDGTQYVGTVGAIAAPEGRVTLENGYGRVTFKGELAASNSYKNDGYAIVGLIYDGAAEKSYYFSNLYGQLTAENKTITALYFCYYPHESGVDHSSPYPDSDALDGRIWDMTDPKNPALRLPEP